VGLFSALCCVSGGCAIMPTLPPDWALPQREIVLHSACELQSTLRFMAQHPPPKGVFDPTAWTVRISLNPKIEADIVPGLGLTRRRPTDTKAIRFSNLVLGGSNGATTDMRGTRTGNLDFVFDSASLLTDDLGCENEPFLLHSLTKTIGIEDWLIGSVNAAVSSHSTIDKPSFSSEVFMKFNGSGSYTYTFPAGTDLASLSGYFQCDEILNINLTAKPATKQVHAVTLPPNGQGFSVGSRGPTASLAVSLQEQRGDLQQIEQAIRNIRFNTQ
jgi:hypothetical protein